MLKVLKATVLAMCLAVFFAVPAFAQTTADEVKTDIVDTATPYFSTLIGIVVALFGLALLVVLARKAAGMARGAIRKG